MSADDRAAIDATALDALARLGDGATALYVGIWDPAKGAYTQAYGESSPGVRAAISDHNRIGSVTKTFTAVAVLQLVADGQIGLRDTLASLVPDLVAEYPAIARVTVDQLLGMRSGIGDFFCCANTFTRTFYADHERRFGVGELVAEGLRMGAPSAEPPREQDYSNTNYVILGEILRVATGRSTAMVLSDLARSAGLPETGLEEPDARAMPEPAARGYVGPLYVAEHHDLLPSSVAAGTDVSAWTLSAAGSAAGMYSTLEELGAWAASGYGSALLPVELAETRLPPAGAPAFSYGYGIIRSGDWIGHGGSVDGWVVDTTFNMETGASWVLIVNSGGGATAFEPLVKFLPEFSF
jgi:D-alanyl-D-alanine carboxypeptidase